MNKYLVELFNSKDIYKYFNTIKEASAFYQEKVKEDDRALIRLVRSNGTKEEVILQNFYL